MNHVLPNCTVEIDISLAPHGDIIIVHPIDIFLARSRPALYAAVQYHALYCNILLRGQVIGKPTCRTGPTSSRRP